MRVLIAGMGSAVGTGIARLLEADDRIEAIAGFDLEPPRRWMRRARFDFARPDDAARILQITGAFAPTVVVHGWVFEPRSRSSPGQARARTVAGTESLLAALESVESVERIVVRSGLSIYGRGRSAPASPSVATPPAPTSTFGRMLRRVEQRCGDVADELDAAMMSVRLAPVMASSLPTPLGRYLRLPVVPVPLMPRKFGVVHVDDAAAVLAAACAAEQTGPINVIAPEPMTPLEAITVGRRIGVPVLPMALRLGRIVAELPGAPLPEHVIELLRHGLQAVPSNLDATVGVGLRYSTRETIRDLYATGRVLDLGRTTRGAA